MTHREIKAVSKVDPTCSRRTTGTGQGMICKSEFVASKSIDEKGCIIQQKRIHGEDRNRGLNGSVLYPGDLREIEYEE